MERERKRLCIVYTGGTLGMRPSPRGYVPARDIRGLLAEKLPELEDPAMPEFGFEEWEPPIDSANATPELWYALAHRMTGLAGRYQGFIVVHGTDTLAYTASALAFLLGGLAKPVVVTGAQVPLFEARNDARANLLAAFEVASLHRPREVSVLFGSRLLLGCRTTKICARSFDAFDSPGYAPLADIGVDIRFRPGNEPDARPSSEPTACPAYRPVSVPVLIIVPGLSAAVVDSLAASGIQGLVLECYGVGTAPDADPDFLSALGRAVDAGVVVVAISQCLDGGVSLGTYATGRALAERGVIGGFDMTREAAVAKLHYLFALGLEPTEVAALMQQNLRGEFTMPNAFNRHRP